MSESRGSKLKLSGRANSVQQATARISLEQTVAAGPPDNAAATAFEAIDLAVLLALQEAPVGSAVTTIAIENGKEHFPLQHPPHPTSFHGPENCDQTHSVSQQNRNQPTAAAAQADPAAIHHDQPDVKPAEQMSGKGPSEGRKRSVRSKASYEEVSDDAGNDAGKDDDASSASLDLNEEDEDDDDDFELDESDDDKPKKKRAPAKAAAGKQAKQAVKPRRKSGSVETSPPAGRKSSLKGRKKPAAPKQSSGKAAPSAAAAAAAGKAAPAAERAAALSGRANQQSGNSAKSGKVLKADPVMTECMISAKLSPDGMEQPEAPAPAQLSAARAKRSLDVLNSGAVERPAACKRPLQPVTTADSLAASSTGASENENPQDAAAAPKPNPEMPGRANIAPKPGTRVTAGTDSSNNRALFGGALAGVMGSFRVAGLRRPQRR